jgi:glycosyltransferase involved in cell wall biosynthesis
MQISCLQDHNINYSLSANISDSQLIQEYRNADMVVFTSTYEGFGLPIVEAQTTGRPVVTSNVYSMPEVAGETACLVDPYQVESIRMGIQRVIADTVYRQKLITSGFKNIKRFKPQYIAAQYVKLYEELI